MNPAEPNPTTARYLAGQMSLEAAATEHAQRWIAWLRAGTLGQPFPAMASGFDPDNLSDADSAKLHALMQRVTSIVEDYEISEGARHIAVVWRFAAHARTLDIEDPSQLLYRCVEDVKQYFQDTFVDTTWPACPRHPNHPLDHADGSWRCPRDQTVVARLGELGQ